MCGISGGVAVWNPGIFLAMYPEFTAAYNADQGKFAACFNFRAVRFLSNCPDSPVQDVQRRLGLLNMLVAHIRYLAGDLSADGQQRPVGRLSAATEGSVNATFDYGQANANNGQWFNQSQYGAELAGYEQFTGNALFAAAYGGECRWRERTGIVKKWLLWFLLSAAPIFAQTPIYTNIPPVVGSGCNVPNQKIIYAVGSNILGVFQCSAVSGTIVQISGTVITPVAHPCGANGQIQFNSNGNCAGASGGTTNGTNWAFGAGSTVDDQGSAILTVEQPAADTSNTGTAIENGVVNWSPATNLPDNYTFNAHSITLNQNLDGQANSASSTTYVNTVTLNENGNTADTGQWGASRFTVNYNGNAPSTNGGGAALYALYINGTGSLRRGVAGLGSAIVIDGAAALSLDASGIVGGGSVTANATINQLAGVQVNPFVIAAGTITDFANIRVDTAPLYGGTITNVSNLELFPAGLSGSTIGENDGIWINTVEDDYTEGGQAGYAIRSDSVAPSKFDGLMDFGDLVSPGILVYADIVTKVAAAGGDGWQANCSDCDTPITEGGVCTATGDHAGALAIQLRGALHCF